MGKSLLPESVETYIASHLVDEDPVAAELYAASMRHEQAGMCSSPEVGAVLALLAKIVDARAILEIGVFTGYSALKLASALPPDGCLIACDINLEFVAIGQPFWEKAGIGNRIDLRIGPALDSIADMAPQSIDLAFIDADKPNYPRYYEDCLRLVRPGGIIILDNLLWGGKVADATVQDDDTIVLRELGRTIIEDPRVDSAMLAVGDGLLVARVRRNSA